MTENMQDENDVLFIGIALERSKTEDEFQSYLNSKGISNWTHFYSLDSEEKSQLSAAYEVQGIPASFIIDQDGKIVEINPKDPESSLRKLLK